MKLLIEDKAFKNLPIFFFVAFINSCGDSEIRNEAISEQEIVIPSITSVELYIENPIFQDITRSVIYKSDTDNVIFSTLESYDPDGKRSKPRPAKGGPCPGGFTRPPEPRVIFQLLKCIFVICLCRAKHELPNGIKKSNV